MDIRTPNAPSSPSQGQLIGGIFARIFWMILGNAILFILLARIYQNARSWVMTGSDWIFWGILGLMLAVRYADIAWCNGETAEGVRATRQDWWRYAGLLATVAGVMWAAVHGLAIYLHRS